MRTPWKALHDFTTPMLAVDRPAWAWRLFGLVWAACIIAPIVFVVWAVRLVANWLVPSSDVVAFLNDHFSATVVVSVVLFFLYSFNRLIWDGFKEPTAKAIAKDNHDG